jgi:hypothetical protein
MRVIVLALCLGLVGCRTYRCVEYWPQQPLTSETPEGTIIWHHAAQCKHYIEVEE